MRSSQARGFPGSALTPRLLADGLDVCSFYHSAPSDQSCHESLSIYTEDITNQKALSTAFESVNPDIVFYLAGKDAEERLHDGRQRDRDPEYDRCGHRN